MERGASTNVEEQSQLEITIKTEVEAAETATAYGDIEIDLNYLKQEPGLVQSVKNEPGLSVKAEILLDSRQGGSEQQYVPGAETPASTRNVNEVRSTGLGDFLNVKQELCDMDVGPTVLQLMDIHYATNKNTSAVAEYNTMMGDSNEAMPGSGVKKHSLEDELRDNKTVSCKYYGQETEDDNDEALVKSCMGQQKDFQKQLLHRTRVTSSNDFMCNRTFQKPHLLSIRKNLHPQTNRKAPATSSAVAGSSNQSRGQSVKIKRKTICIKEKPFACDICRKGYSSKAGLNLHKRSHSVVKPSACHTFDTKLGVKSHLTNYQPQGKKHCDAKFELLTKHMRVHTGEKPYQCDMCDARFSWKTGIIQHMRIHTGEKPYQCDKCQARFAQSRGLSQHRRIHTSKKTYGCDMCEARFAQSSALTQHIRVHTGEKPYKCEICNARFVQRRSVTRHMRVHTGVNPYQCDMCDARFSWKTGIMKHMRIHTGEKPYQCDKCDLRFSVNGALTNHMRIHTGEKPYQCDICHARFTQDSSLTQHMRVHTGEKPYQCDMCDARFTQRSNVTRHMRVHTGEKPYKCEMCDARFAFGTGIVQHMRIHTGEKPYQCDTCEARFAQSSGLSQHRRIHTSKKPYKCEICDARYVERRSVTRHMRVHTG